MREADFTPTDTVWGSLIVACGKAGQLESALGLWQDYKEARGGLQNVKDPGPSIAVLVACGQTFQLAPALQVLADLREAGVLSALVSSLHACGLLCLSLCESMLVNVSQVPWHCSPHGCWLLLTSAGRHIR